MAAFTLFALAAAVLAATAPLTLSFASVWLFAGPHNWMEARYFLSRLPRRWAVRRGFVVLALGGTAVLGVVFASGTANELWFTAVGIWVLGLIQLAGRDWELAAGPVCAAVALAWWSLDAAGLLLLYLHPVAALWFVWRQTGKRWPDRARWPAAAAIAILAGCVAVKSQSGLALHAYLELLHYGAWVVALPWIGLASKPWEWRTIPLARRWPRAIPGMLIAGAFGVVVLWAGLAVDYNRVRGLYFTIAIFHVLAEAPMLIWLR